MPVSKQFPKNNVIAAVEYNSPAQELTIHYVNAATGVRTYGPVPSDVFYKLYYLKTLKEMLSYYAQNIKQKYQWITKK